MNDLVIRMKSGIRVQVPARLDSITTYVLLEQEQWFEREVQFIAAWLKPGMTAIDIGANLGVYALTMARAVGEGGHVYAFEPAAAVRASLEASRDINGIRNLTVIGAALADTEREGWLDYGQSSELNAIGEGGSAAEGRLGEPIRVSTLDAQEREVGWPAPDFVKIDAEGAEALILEGAPRFFREHSPLIMFEVKAGATQNKGLQALFEARGFVTYRLLGNGRFLVPAPVEAALDGFELNLFACKPDRARLLEGEGWLAAAATPYSPTPEARAAGLRAFHAQPFAGPLAQLGHDPARFEPALMDGLAAFVLSRDAGRPAAERYGALLHAHGTLGALCDSQPSVSRLSMFARVAVELGERGHAVSALRIAMQMLGGTDPIGIGEPFWPADERFDAIDPGAQFGDWFVTSVAESLERLCAYSSIFGKGPVPVEWTAALPFASAEMERRRVLAALLAGQPASMPDRLAVEAPDNLNADIWKAVLAPRATATA